MKHKTRKLLSILLALVMVAGLLPLGHVAYAADELTVNVVYDSSTRTASVSWNTIPGAVSYGARLKNDNEDGTAWAQANNTRTLGVSTTSCTFDSENYIMQYGNGGKNYKVSVYAVDKDGNEIAEGESAVFQTGLSPLSSAPTVTLSSNGIASWTAVDGATNYYFACYQGSYTNPCEFGKQSQVTMDFSGYFSPGFDYFVEVCAIGNGSTTRNSKIIKSDTVTVPGEKKEISGLKWSGTKLTWDDFSGANGYYLRVMKEIGGTYVMQKNIKHNQSSYDFSSQFSNYGKGSYKIKVTACKGTIELSNDTASPIYEYSEGSSTFAFTTQPASGTAKKTEQYTFSWTLNDTPDTLVFQTWDNNNNSWKDTSLSTSPSTVGYNALLCDGNVSKHRIKVTKDTDTIYSDEFMVTWTDDSTTFYTVTVTNDGNGTAFASPPSGPDGTVVALTATPNPGYKFKEWVRVSGYLSGGLDVPNATSETTGFQISGYDVEVKATFEEDDTYTGTVNNDGNGTAFASPASGPVGKVVTLTATPNPGYKFKEWVQSGMPGEFGNKTSAQTTFKILGNVTVTARFERDTFNVTVNNDGNGTAFASPASGPDGTVVTLTAIPNPGYKFLRWERWSGFMSGGTAVPNATSATTTFKITESDVTVNAVFERDYTVTIYNVFFVANEGGGTMTPVTWVGSYTLPTCGFTAPTNKEFDQWEVGETKYDAGDTITISGDTWVTAVWNDASVTPTIYTVSFNNGGGTGSKADEPVNAGAEYTLPAADTFTAPTNKEFDKWSVTIGTNPAVDKNPNDKIIVTANTTVTAVWKDKAVTPTIYTVSFNNGGGTGTKANEPVNAGASYTLPAADTFGAPSAAKEFEKWSVKIGSAEPIDKQPNDTIQVIADTTVTAVWKDKATKTLSSIAITTPPTKTTYTAGQSFNKAGMVVTATYSDTSKADVTGYTVSPSGALKTTDTSVTISYTEGGITKTTTQPITVNSSGGGGGGGGGITTQYTLTYQTNGGSTVSATKHNSGATVNLTATPTKEGFTFDGWYSDAALTSKITSIKMDGNKTVYAGWKENEKPGHDCPSAHLKDIDPNAWYHEYVDYVVENGLMYGIADDRFGPDVTTSRAMIVTILYRLENSPAVSGSSPFDDVAEGLWYTDAVKWAEANEIVEGYSPEKFGPNDNITREQFAAIMYRYSQFKGYDVSKTADLSGYADASEISDWAVPAMKWAVAEGLIAGRTTTTLVPRGNATRAEAATILMRYIESAK